MESGGHVLKSKTLILLYLGKKCSFSRKFGGEKVKPLQDWNSRSTNQWFYSNRLSSWAEQQSLKEQEIHL